MPIDPGSLLTDRQKLLRALEDNLRERCADVPDVDAKLRQEYARAKEANRTGEAYEVWRDEYLTQVGVAWILGCVFVRFLEDNELIDAPRLSGPGERLQRARDHHTVYFQRHPTESDREYLYAVFREVAELPGAGPLFDERHNPLWQAGISGDGATLLLDFWQKIDPSTGALIHDFTSTIAPPCQRVPISAQAPFETAPGKRGLLRVSGKTPSEIKNPTARPEEPPFFGGVSKDRSGEDPQSQQGGGQGEVLDTRFLGDLYQDISEAARKRYALLQTPEFVEEFILDRTLTPAIEEFGWREVRLLDPTCGSGHFLLGGFRRLFDLWARNEPGTNARELAQRALDQVYGVDVNPFAVAIARFRLLLAALRACGVTRLRDAPDFRVNVATGDSLLHGPRFTATTGPTPDLFDHSLRHVYFAEDRDDLARILGRQYHAVVGNPPYITVKDKALNQAYRDRYGSCHRKYSLAVPFMERFFELATPLSAWQGDRRGVPAGPPKLQRRRASPA